MNSIDFWFQGPPFFVAGYEICPSGDVNTELPNDDPELRKDITFCSTLV